MVTTVVTSTTQSISAGVLLDLSHNNGLLTKDKPCCVPTRKGWFHSHGILRIGSPKGVNSLTAIDGHDRQYFNELRSTVVSCRIFIRSQSLIAR